MSCSAAVSARRACCSPVARSSVRARSAQPRAPRRSNVVQRLLQRLARVGALAGAPQPLAEARAACGRARTASAGRRAAPAPPRTPARNSASGASSARSRARRPPAPSVEPVLRPRRVERLDQRERLVAAAGAHVRLDQVRRRTARATAASAGGRRGAASPRARRSPPGSGRARARAARARRAGTWRSPRPGSARSAPGPRSTCAPAVVLVRPCPASTWRERGEACGEQRRAARCPRRARPTRTPRPRGRPAAAPEVQVRAHGERVDQRAHRAGVARRGDQRGRRSAAAAVEVLDPDRTRAPAMPTISTIASGSASSRYGSQALQQRVALLDVAERDLALADHGGREQLDGRLGATWRARARARRWRSARACRR